MYSEIICNISFDFLLYSSSVTFVRIGASFHNCQLPNSKGSSRQCVAPKRPFLCNQLNVWVVVSMPLSFRFVAYLNIERLNISCVAIGTNIFELTKETAWCIIACIDGARFMRDITHLRCTNRRRRICHHQC